jgi:hypothetical protein
LAEVRDEIFDRVEAVRVGEENYLLADAAGAPELRSSLNPFIMIATTSWLGKGVNKLMTRSTRNPAGMSTD